MKRRSIALLFASFLIALPQAHAAAAPAAEGQAVVVERGPHHRVWQRTLVETGPDGRVQKRTQTYTELATGLHYLGTDGQWKESRAEIEVSAEGGIARQTPHRAIFPPNTGGALDVQARDGIRLQSRVMGLSYFDTATRRSVLIAELKEAVQGELHAPSTVIYPDAFDDAVRADLRYRYRKSGYEQDVIFRAALPSPREWNLNPETCLLELHSEFFDAPVPAKRARRLANGLVDETLDFSQTRIGPGRAFTLGDEPRGQKSIPVSKTWTTIQGRTFLIESVPFTQLQRLMASLPKGQASVSPRRAATAPALARVLPPPRPIRKETGPLLTAAVPRNDPGVVLDYVTLDASLTNYLFRGDETYYVSDGVYVAGTATFEGGTVIKYDSDGERYLKVQNAKFLTAAYRPAIFTAKDDDTVGTVLTNSTGNPQGTYGCPALWTEYDASWVEYAHLRIAYADTALQFHESCPIIKHCQFLNCDFGIYNEYSSAYFENDLFYQVGVPFCGDDFDARVTHATFHHANSLRPEDASIALYLTNCILVDAGEWNQAPITTNSIYVTNSSTIFQTVGAASHYLAADSPLRDSGTTNINATLLAELAQRTTYAPEVVAPSGGWYTSNRVLTPWVPRDTGQPDLGYHYDPLDYAFTFTALSNCTFNVQPGTAIGTFTTNGTYSLGLVNEASLVSEGTPTQPVWIVRYNTVQEQATTNWAGPRSPSIYAYDCYVEGLPDTTLRFTHFSQPASDACHFYGYAGTHFNARFRDCEFYSGMFQNDGAKLCCTNNLFHRVNTILADGDYVGIDLAIHNSLFYGGQLTLYQYDMGGNWTLTDNLFNKTILDTTDSVLTHAYNAYLTNQNRLTPNSTNDVVLLTTNLNYDTGALGGFYYNTNDTHLARLVDAGSVTNAGLVGLYHYTTTTNQLKDGSSPLDIGYHVVALGTNGLPVDTDQDGLPDYWEDRNGNGLVDAPDGSWNWTNYNSLNGLSSGSPLQVYTPLK